MTGQIVKVAEWISRALAVGALFVAFRPADAVAADAGASDQTGKEFRAAGSEVVVGATVEVDVDNEEPPIRSE